MTGTRNQKTRGGRGKGKVRSRGERPDYHGVTANHINGFLPVKDERWRGRGGFEFPCSRHSSGWWKTEKLDRFLPNALRDQRRKRCRNSERSRRPPKRARAERRNGDQKPRKKLWKGIKRWADGKKKQWLPVRILTKNIPGWRAGFRRRAAEPQRTWCKFQCGIP